MRHFIVRTVTGPMEPREIISGLWQNPQWSRMLMYSVLIHVCIATSFLLVKMLNLPFTKTLPAITYTVDLVELQRPEPKKHAAVAKRNVKKKQPKPKPPPPPKPEPKPEPKPPPKPEPKKNVVPPPEKKIEVPKVVEKPKPEEKPPEVKVPPDPPKEEIPPPPPPEPEPPAPMEVTKAIEPEPIAESTVDLDTEYITPELKWYIEIIRRKVWQNWIEPVHALAPGTYARVVIRFEIGRDGTFASEPVIYESSNIFLLDQSGFRAVLRSAPFPPLPESYSGTSLGVRFGFEYGEKV